MKAMESASGQCLPAHRVPLNSPVYTTAVRLRGWNGLRTAKSVCTTSATVSVIRKLRPDLRKEDHCAIAKYHQARVEKLNKIWNLVVDRAAQESFGRPFQFGDYKICAIASDEFADRHKRVLRHCAYRATEHKHMVVAHVAAARTSRGPGKVSASMS